MATLAVALLRGLVTPLRSTQRTSQSALVSGGVQKGRRDGPRACFREFSKQFQGSFFVAWHIVQPESVDKV